MSDAAGYQWLDTGTYRKRLPADAVPEHWQALHTQTALDAAVAAERERYAKLCEGLSQAAGRRARDTLEGDCGYECADAIRGV